MRNKKKLSDNLIGETRKSRRRVIVRSTFLVLFLLGVNTFAWFTYISRADVSLNGSVIAWDVNFMDENGAVKEILVDIKDMKPGMLTYEKKVEIVNQSDVAANMNYEIKSVKFLGNTILEGETTENITNKFANDYPFVLTMTATKDNINVNDKIIFDIKMDWIYEDNTYYKLDSLYAYDAGVNYYTLVNGTYQVDSTVTSENFNEKVAAGLYLEKDNADSYFGYACGNYEKSTNNPCLQMEIELKVTQAN